MPQGPKGERRPADVIGNAFHVMVPSRHFANKILKEVGSPKAF